MAQQRLTDRTALAETPNDSDLVHIVDVSDTTDNATGTSKKITVANLLSGVVQSASQPVENEYADITALLAGQGSQTETFFQYVVDASADPNIASGDAYYEKLASSTATLATDYRLLSDTETTTILDSNGYRVFRVQYIQDDASPNTTANGGRIGFNYDTGTDKVTSIVFNTIYSDALDVFYAQRASYDYYLKIYNRNTGVYSFVYITGWTASGNYYIVDVDATMDIAEISVNNRVEVYFLLDQNTGGGGGSGTVTSVAVSGSDGIEVDSGSPITTSGTIALGLNKANTLTFLNVEDGADVTDSTNVDAAGAVMESDYNANTILAATTDNTPTTLTVAEQTLVGRITGGNIDSLTISEVKTLLIDRLEEDSTVTGTKNIDWGAYETFYYTMTGNTTFSDTNLPSSGSKTITLYMTGDFTPTYPTGWDTYISGTYDGTALNTIVVEYVKAGTPFWKVQISQPD